MIHFLRDSNNNTLVDAQATAKDIGVVVCIGQYSRFLLCNQSRADEVIKDFDKIQEMRGELFESGWEGTPDALAASRLQSVATKYGLSYVTD